jgi:hypothetical protein
MAYRRAGWARRDRSRQTAIGVGYDGSSESDHAFVAGGELAACHGSRIKVQSVVSLQSRPHGEAIPENSLSGTSSQSEPVTTRSAYRTTLLADLLRPHLQTGEMGVTRATARTAPINCEREVSNLIAAGTSNVAIAEALVVSPGP